MPVPQCYRAKGILCTKKSCKPVKGRVKESVVGRKMESPLMRLRKEAVVP